MRVTLVRGICTISELIVGFVVELEIFIYVVQSSRGKRDGLSKEGSGRVAIYKCTGLIKSYTLECNYNTGKSVNILPLRGKELATAKVQSPVPPKYTPAVFEEVKQ